MSDTPNNPTGTIEQQDDSGIQEFTVTAYRKLPSPDTFIANVNAPKKQSLARSSRFNVEIKLPKALSEAFEAYGRDDTKSLHLFCEAAEFPGRSLDVTDFRIYGLSYKIPTKTTYNEITMTFLCDAHMTQKVFFDDWMDYINPTYRGFETGISYDMEYRDNYVAPIYINQYNELDRNTYMVELSEAYPISVTALQTNWADDNFHRVQVTFSFYEWIGLSMPPKAVPYQNGFGYDPRNKQYERDINLFMDDQTARIQEALDITRPPAFDPGLLETTLYRTISIPTEDAIFSIEMPQSEPKRSRRIIRRRRFK